MKREDLVCRYMDCRKNLPGPYGTAGVSLSRSDGRSLICSGCGVREAMNPAILASHFHGAPHHGVS